MTKQKIVIIILLLLTGVLSLYLALSSKAEMGVKNVDSITENLSTKASSENNSVTIQAKDDTIKSKIASLNKTETSSTELVKEASIEQVDIKVKFSNPEKNISDTWIFQIAMDTHSVDLDQIDLQNSVYFIGDNGKMIDDGFIVKRTGSGHHISQYIELPKVLNGENTIEKEFKSFKMVFKDINGINLTELTWDMTNYNSIFNE